MVCFCWQRCFVVACYVIAWAQAAGWLSRMTKRPFLWTIYKEISTRAYGMFCLSLAVIQQLSLQSLQFSTIPPCRLGWEEASRYRHWFVFHFPGYATPCWSSTSISSCLTPSAPLGVSPGDGGLPAWLAASAPSSPLQTPITCAATARPPPSLQPNTGAL